jgi:small subunit ribosomal protein S3
MGQKTHPKGFRLVTTQKHLSEWYSPKADYSSLIEEDFFIRSKVPDFFADFLSVAKTEIHRIQQESDGEEYVNITIHALFPRAKEMSRKVTKYLAESGGKKLALPTTGPGLRKITGFLVKRSIRNFIRFLQTQKSKKYYIAIQFIENPYQDATLIAKYFAEQLERRASFRRTVRTIIKKVQRTSMKGIKIEVSGRLNGAEIARSEWKRDGKVPLHTLNADIDYVHYMAHTVYGVIGIKVWLFKG